MFRRLVVTTALAVSCVVPFASVVAQPASLIPGLHMMFTMPTGTAYQNSPIDIFITLALDAGAPAFNFNGTSYDPSSPTPFGIPASTLPTSGFQFDVSGTPADFAPGSYNSAFLFLVPDCLGTFLPGCPDGSGPPYDFVFDAGLMTSATFFMAPGTSMDFLLGTLVPTGDSAPLGTYTLAGADIFAQVNGHDASGDDVFGFTPNLVDACTNADPSCGFSRTIVPAPEPATLGLLALGLGFVGAIRKRRSA